MAQHGIEDRQQLVHARGQHHLGGLARRPQPLGERPDHRVAPDRHQGSHVQHAAQSTPAAPDDAPTPLPATVVVERRHPDQRPDRLVTQQSQLRQLGQQRRRQHHADPWHAAQQRVPLAPDRTGPDLLGQLLLHLGQLLAEKGDVPLQPGPDHR